MDTHPAGFPQYGCHVDHDDVERLRNRWVAVGDDGAVVADSASFEGLHERLAQQERGHVVIRRIPAADEPLFVGLR